MPSRGLTVQTDAIHRHRRQRAPEITEASRLGFSPDASRIRSGSAKLTDAQGELRPFQEVEEDVIRFALAHCSGQVSEVARRLGIGRSTLYRKLRNYGIPAGTARRDD